jgi:hypothetical protein
MDLAMLDGLTGPQDGALLPAFPPPLGRALYAVDFSGAASYARKLWIAAWRPGGAARLLCGADLAGFTYAALAERIAASEGVWLLDFPFGLPTGLAAELDLPTDDWAALVRAFAARYEAPAAFYAATHPLPTGNREPKRRCDLAHHTPMAPTNRRVIAQTFYGLRSVLLPLLDGHRARVALLPWDAAVAAARPVWVAEGCPASVLRRGRLRAAGYKGKTAACQRGRAALLAALAASGLPIEADAQRRALGDAEGDGLDALILLTAAARCADPRRAARLAPDYPDHAARLHALLAAGLAVEADVYA